MDGVTAGPPQAWREHWFEHDQLLQLAIDALSRVPRELREASAALGASRELSRWWRAGNRVAL